MKPRTRPVASARECLLGLALCTCGTSNEGYLRSEVAPLAEDLLRCPRDQILTECVDGKCDTAAATGCGRTVQYSVASGEWRPVGAPAPAPQSALGAPSGQGWSRPWQPAPPPTPGDGDGVSGFSILPDGAARVSFRNTLSDGATVIEGSFTQGTDKRMVTRFDSPALSDPKKRKEVLAALAPGRSSKELVTAAVSPALASKVLSKWKDDVGLAEDIGGIRSLAVAGFSFTQGDQGGLLSTCVTVRGDFPGAKGVLSSAEITLTADANVDGKVTVDIRSVGGYDFKVNVLRGLLKAGLVDEKGSMSVLQDWVSTAGSVFYFTHDKEGVLPTLEASHPIAWDAATGMFAVRDSKGNIQFIKPEKGQAIPMPNGETAYVYGGVVSLKAIEAKYKISFRAEDVGQIIGLFNSKSIGVTDDKGAFLPGQRRLVLNGAVHLEGEMATVPGGALVHQYHKVYFLSGPGAAMQDVAVLPDNTPGVAGALKKAMHEAGMVKVDRLVLDPARDGSLTLKVEGRKADSKTIVSSEVSVPSAATSQRLAQSSPRDALAGSNPVRVTNPNEFGVQVELRSRGLARAFAVQPNDSTTVHVADGTYDIFFVYSNEEDATYQGDGFTLSHNGVEIRIVKVVDGNYGIRRVR
jgi:hypothetical protein